MKLTDDVPDQSWKAVGEVAQPKEVEGYLVAEMTKALGLSVENRLGAWLAPFFGTIVRGFALKAVEFDEAVAQKGLQASAQEWLSKMVAGLNIFGKETLPQEGSVLIAANHPGTYDGLAIAAAVQRPDLKILASGNPFFRSLPNVREYFIYATRDTHVRMAAIRTALRHLQAGGALLIFPYGRVEPDPLYFKQEARMTLVRWSGSLELMLHKVPQAKLVFAVNWDSLPLSTCAIRFSACSRALKGAKFLQNLSRSSSRSSSTGKLRTNRGSFFQNQPRWLIFREA